MVLMLFTARCYASVVLATGLCLSVSVCLSVCLSVSVASRSSTKTAKRRITQTTPHDSPGTLVFGYQRSPRNSTGITPDRGAKCRWGGSKSATFDKSWLYLDKKLSYRQVIARCVLSVVILPITTQQCRNYLYDKS